MRRSGTTYDGVHLEVGTGSWYDNVHLADVLKPAGFTAAHRFAPLPNPDGVDSTGRIPWTCVVLYEVEADDLRAAHASLLTAADRGEHGLGSRAADGAGTGRPDARADHRVPLTLETQEW